MVFGLRNQWIYLLTILVVMVSDAVADADIDRLSAGVVQVRTSEGSGSGTLVLYEGRAAVLTNRHVVEGQSEFVIAALEDLNRPAEPKFRARLKAYSLQHDFAFLELTHTVAGERFSLETLERGGYGVRPELIDLNRYARVQVRRGDTVGILGYPGIGRNDLVYTTGIVSSLQLGKVGRADVPIYYLTNAEISPGNSGGMAFNQNGQFIGIPTSVARESRTGGRLAQILPLPLILEIMKDSAAMSSSWAQGYRPPLSSRRPPASERTRLNRADLDGGMTGTTRSGGPVEVSDLGPDCIGFFPNAPQFELQISVNVPDLLFAFMASDDRADTTLIIESPDGRFHCNDDAFDGTLNPGIMLDNARSGLYSIWVGSYHRSDYHDGTLLVGTSAAFTDDGPAKTPEPGHSTTSALNWRRPPTNGSTQLSPGFSPDPHRVGLLAGGDIDLRDQRMSSACVGHVASAPDYAITWTGHSGPLHIFFVADRPDDDATLIVRIPSGRWLCNDDAGRWTYNPLISIDTAAPGTYQIWVGTINGGQMMRGELRITELSPSVP